MRSVSYRWVGPEFILHFCSFIIVTDCIAFDFINEAIFEIQFIFNMQEVHIELLNIHVKSLSLLNHPLSVHMYLFPYFKILIILPLFSTYLTKSDFYIELLHVTLFLHKFSHTHVQS